MRKVYIGDDQGRNDEKEEPWTKDNVRAQLSQLSVMAECDIVGDKAIIKVREGYGDGEYLSNGFNDLNIIRQKAYKTEKKNGCTLFYVKL